MQDIFISFVVPIYNMENYLSRCVKSILNQSYSNFEVILVDDGSKDKSGTICNEFKKQDDRIKVIHKINGGVSSARNIGIKATRGDYICFVDPDDWIETNLLEEFIKNIDDQDDVFVYGHRMVENYTKFIDKDYPVETISGVAALNKFVLNKINGYSWNKIVRRTLIFENNIFFPEGRNYEDISTTYKMLLYARQIKITEKPLYNYYVNNVDSITSRDNSKNLKDYYLACNEMYQGIKQYYMDNSIDCSTLECFRINLYIQLYIRLLYYICNNSEENNSQIKDIKNNVKKVLKEKQVSLNQLKNFVNFNKYILFKLHLIDMFVLFKAKRARGYKR